MKTITISDEMYEKLQVIGYAKNTDINGALQYFITSELGDAALSEDEKECNFIRFLVEQYFTVDDNGKLATAMNEDTQAFLNEYLTARFVTKDKVAENFAWVDLYPALERLMKNGAKSRDDFDLVTSRL